MSGPAINVPAGTYVRTADPLGDHGFDSSVTRRPGVTGNVKSYHVLSHGGFYRITHCSDGTEGCYDPTELTPITVPAEKPTDALPLYGDLVPLDSEVIDEIFGCSDEQLKQLDLTFTVNCARCTQALDRCNCPRPGDWLEYRRRWLEAERSSRQGVVELLQIQQLFDHHGHGSTSLNVGSVTKAVKALFTRTQNQATELNTMRERLLKLDQLVNITTSQTDRCPGNCSRGGDGPACGKPGCQG